MSQLQINMSNLMQGFVGSAMVGVTILLWTTLSDLNKAVGKLEATVQLSNASIHVLDGQLKEVKLTLKERDEVVSDWFSMLQRQRADIDRLQMQFDFGKEG